ncbi:MAG TPA: class I SAM-dependent methyltransferase [Pirellulales bacterium]
MFASDQYQLLDFGAGRKLERFGRYVVDRPSPAAGDAQPAHPELWPQADAVFQRPAAGEGRWTVKRELVDWAVRWNEPEFELRLAASGQVGLFPEQAVNWQWLSRQLRQTESPKVLNLFAYTGSSSLVAAQAGAEVVHVDAAAAAIAMARRNAERSGLADRPLRWVEEDALAFVRREVRRGNRYQAVVLDPPSYGHGPKGQTWKLATQLDELVEQVSLLVDRRAGCVLLTCHTPGYGPHELVRILEASLASPARGAALELATADGRRLHSGSGAVWTSEP